MNLLIAVVSHWRREIFTPAIEQRLENVASLLPVDPPESADADFLRRHIADAEAVITSWETAQLDESVVEEARSLRLVLHAGGSLKPIVSDALYDRGVRVVSAAAALGPRVAEYCLAMFLLGGKRAYWAGMACRDGRWLDGVEAFHGPHELYRTRVGVIGTGQVGRELIRLLKNFTCTIVAYDPYLSAADAEQLGVEKAENLDALFESCLFVSLNAPTTDETVGMIRGGHFRLLPEGATFVNSARAAIIHEQEFIEELRTGRFVACIDVTDPEPPPADHPLRRLPNVWLTPHVAGTRAENLQCIGDFVADELHRFARGEDLLHAVSQDELARLA